MEEIVIIIRDEAIAASEPVSIASLLSWSNWNLETVVFQEGSRKTCQTWVLREENQQQTQPTSGTGLESNPGLIGDQWALLTLQYPFFSKKKTQTWLVASLWFLSSSFSFVPSDAKKINFRQISFKNWQCWWFSSAYPPQYQFVFLGGIYKCCALH